jgi:hypothetical protein
MYRSRYDGSDPEPRHLRVEAQISPLLLGQGGCWQTIMADSRVADHATEAQTEDALRATAAACVGAVGRYVETWTGIADTYEALPPVPSGRDAWAAQADAWHVASDGTMEALLLYGAYNDVEETMFEIADTHDDCDHLWWQNAAPPPAPPSLAPLEGESRLQLAVRTEQTVKSALAALMERVDDDAPCRKLHAVLATLNECPRGADRPTVARADALLTALELAAAKRGVSTRRIKA